MFRQAGIFFKILNESIQFAWHALVSNRLRTFLSLLGISIGIFAIVSVFTVVDSLEGNLRSSVESLGNNVIYVQKWPWIFDDNTPWWRYMNRPIPKPMEVEELKKRTSSAESITYAADLPGQLVKRRSSSIENANITGVSFEYQKVKSFELQEGRYFTPAETAGGRSLAIIGYDISKELFNGDSPIGKTISAKGVKFQVIGVFKKEGESIFGSSDNTILIPINFMRKKVDLHSNSVFPYIMVKAKKLIPNAQLKDELRGAMRSIRRLSPREEDDFALNESSVLSSSLDSLFSFLGKAGWIIGGFSILVGGFGIANIMFVSVKERTNIIGIQKSLGAKNYFILMQFLFESVLLCVLGGIVGLGIVFMGTLLSTYVFDLSVALSLSNIVFALSFSALIGIVSGFIPAYSAAQLDPVEAIRTN